MMKMKRFIAVALTAALTIPVIGCGGQSADLYSIDTESQEYKDYMAGELSESEIEELKEKAMAEGEAKDAKEAADPKETTDSEEVTAEEEAADVKEAADPGKAKAEESEDAAKKEAEKESEDATNKEAEKESEDAANKEAEKESDNAANKETEKDATEDKEESAASKNYLALGKNLTDAQISTVLELMGISKEELDTMDVVYVTNEEEHAFLDSYIDPAKIGKNALSSVLVKPMEKGYGINVTTKNINYCTPEMYKNAFMTAGVNDADIIVAGPFELSGTAALIGAVKAYEELSGISVSEMVVDAAVDELITTGEIAEAVGSKEDSAKLISEIKDEIINNNPASKSEIEEIVRGILDELGFSLSDEDIDRIVDLILKIVKAFAMQKLTG
ncbi:MAG: DUF1002 domain-containing protein [Lachnospiraceae bacterium]|nr:DUF1002 domain-containing protein [Lachnospiraceae bacterium]